MMLSTTPIVSSAYYFCCVSMTSCCVSVWNHDVSVVRNDSIRPMIGRYCHCPFSVVYRPNPEVSDATYNDDFDECGHGAFHLLRRRHHHRPFQYCNIDEFGTLDVVVVVDGMSVVGVAAVVGVFAAGGGSGTVTERKWGSPLVPHHRPLAVQ